MIDATKKNSVDSDDKQERLARRQRRARHAQETNRLLRRLRYYPTLEDAIFLHELHAQHERERGNEEAAARADARAAAGRLRLQSR